MARHAKKGSAKNARAPALCTSHPLARQSLSGWKLWSFRLSLSFLAPVLLLLLLEISLWLFGFGYPTSFLLPSIIKGKAVFIQNDRFGWRFFGPSLSRQPFPFAISRSKPIDTVRIFVFGESAAYGDPQPEFGLARMLETLLSLRYPGARFEVINAAMTGINSHVILPIARDCTRAHGDIWVIYMGNNEVVGPFGAGTVFGPQSPSLAMVRATLAVKATKTGQFLDSLFQHLHPLPPDQTEWGGMLMFLDHQVRHDGSQMRAVYEHFNHNLNDILQLGRASGAAIVVGTVAVNLKDCAPFASLHRPSSSLTSRSQFRDLFRRGLAAQQAHQNNEALGFFRDAEKIDDTVAELQFAIAQSLLAIGNKTEAEHRFVLSRDLDVLRFRCDSHLNEITRQLCSNHREQRILLADAEREFARQSPDGAPGAEFFYEHVHLTFEGNYLLALTFAEKVEQLLPETVRLPAKAQRPWPSAEDCARRLGWTDFQRLAGLEQVLGRLNDPPFTSQSNHAEQLARLGRRADHLRPTAQAAARQASVLCREALVTTPDDPILCEQLARTLGISGDLKGAVAAAQTMTELLPNSASAWMLLGEALSADQRFEASARAFSTAFQVDPQNVWALQNLGKAYEKLGRHDEAIREFKHALRIKPRLGTAWLALGQLLEQAGQNEEAEKDYRLALKNPIHKAEALASLAQICQNRGWLPEALTNYLNAIKLNSSDSLLRIKAGLCLATLGRNQEAKQQYAEAVRVTPDSVQGRFLLGVALGREGKPAEAAEQFRNAVRLKPELMEARLNLAIALLDQGQKDEALNEFREVLRRNPTNAVALRNLRALESK